MATGNSPAAGKSCHVLSPLKYWPAAPGAMIGSFVASATVIFAVPSNATPLIVRGVVSFVADRTFFVASAVLSTLSNANAVFNGPAATSPVKPATVETPAVPDVAVSHLVPLNRAKSPAVNFTPNCVPVTVTRHISPGVPTPSTSGGSFAAASQVPLYSNADTLSWLDGILPEASNDAYPLFTPLFACNSTPSGNADSGS